MAISANIFAKCLPAISTNIDRCGSLTVCNAVPAQTGDLEAIFTSSGAFRLMGSLLASDIIAKACGARTYGMYDFWQAQARDKSKSVKPVRADSKMIEPFIEVERPSVVNREYWSVVTGSSTGGNNAQFHLRSRNGFPADIRFFKPRARIYIQGVSIGGSSTVTAWRINSAAASNSGGYTTVLVQTTSENLNSNLSASKLELPTGGFATMGPPNVNSYEQYCQQEPGINPTQLYAAWLEERRRTFQSCTAFKEYENLVMGDNAYYKKFLYVPETVQNRANAENFMRERVNSYFWGKAAQYQTLAQYRSLDNITAATASDMYLPDEGVCVGKRANLVGMYEQLAECGYVRDEQGNQLNMEELFIILHQLSRNRKDQGGMSDSWKNIDIVCDSPTARQINRAMTLLFKLESADSLVYNVQMGQSKNGGQNEHFGFYYTSWPLPNYPSARFNVITLDAMDDIISAANSESAAIATAARRLWILDWSGLYPAIVATDKVVNTTGRQEEVAKVDAGVACTMRTHEMTVVKDSVTEAFVVECPANNLIIENFSAQIPEWRGAVGDPSDIYGGS